MAVYVDDIIIAAENQDLVDKIIHSIERRFEVHDYADCSKYLGLNIEVDNAAIFIDQTKYIDNIRLMFQWMTWKIFRIVLLITNILSKKFLDH